MPMICSSVNRFFMELSLPVKGRELTSQLATRSVSGQGHRGLAARLQRGPAPQQLRADPACPVRCQPPSTASQQRSNLQPRALSVITGTASGGQVKAKCTPNTTRPASAGLVLRRLSGSDPGTVCHWQASLHQSRPSSSQINANLFAIFL